MQHMHVKRRTQQEAHWDLPSLGRSLSCMLCRTAEGSGLMLCDCRLQAGAFRIGDTAGTLDNIAACKLHRPGSVGFVSKSGGMSNEMYNVLSRTTDGLYEGQS